MSKDIQTWRYLPDYVKATAGWWPKKIDAIRLFDGPEHYSYSVICNGDYHIIRLCSDYTLEVLAHTMEELKTEEIAYILGGQPCACLVVYLHHRKWFKELKDGTS